MDVIFLAGVHGVGKGTAANILSKKYKLKVFSASELIRKEKKSIVDVNKVVKGASENQDHLTSAVKNLKVNVPTILLDGHFCLNSENGIFRVPENTFNKLNLKAVFLLCEQPELISERLLSRDGSALSVKSIETLQNEEVKQAKHITTLLNIPLYIAKSGQLSEFERYLSCN
jgi:adenylate kinase